MEVTTLKDSGPSDLRTTHVRHRGPPIARAVLGSAPWIHVPLEPPSDAHSASGMPASPCPVRRAPFLTDISFPGNSPCARTIFLAASSPLVPRDPATRALSPPCHPSRERLAKTRSAQCDLHGSRFLIVRKFRLEGWWKGFPGRSAGDKMFVGLHNRSYATLGSISRWGALTAPSSPPLAAVKPLHPRFKV